MSGPDSDLWPAWGHPDREWNWQSSAPCDVIALADADADDDQLLAIASRYTVENLVLNAVHEIGEWLRFDGERLCPAHLPRTGPPGQVDDQGNGAVHVQVTFGLDARPASAASHQVPAHDAEARTLVARLAECAASSRFTYVPGAAISFETDGPVVRSHARGAPSVWRSNWSPQSLHAVDAHADDLINLAGRDIHRALVLFETDRICRAFHVDGRQRWHLASPRPPVGAGPRDEEPGTDPLAVSISYSDAGDRTSDRSLGPVDFVLAAGSQIPMV